MRSHKTADNRRILVIDDDAGIRQAYERLLSPEKKNSNTPLQQMEHLLTANGNTEPAAPLCFDVQSASQGRGGLELVQIAIQEDRPFAVAFIDIRMPPGWDGMQTAKKIRDIDPDIEIVIVTAYSDRSRDEIVRTVGAPEKLLFLRKPFDYDELLQLALSLTEKWNIAEKEKKAKSDLVKSESRFRALVETTSDFFWETDVYGTFIYCSPVSEKIYGYTSKELEGLSLRHFFLDCETGVSVMSRIEPNSEDGAFLNSLERVVKKKSGEKVVIETRCALILDNNGWITGYRGIDRDITQKKNG